MYLVLSMVFLNALFIGEVSAAEGDEIEGPGNGAVFKGDNQCTDSFDGILDIKSSFILSTLTLCLPGMLEKAEQYRQLNCQAALCTYQASVSGYDSSLCDRTYAYQTCVEIKGEIFALPFFNVVDMIISGVKDALANPLLYIINGGVAYMRNIAATNCVNGVCQPETHAFVFFALAVIDVIEIQSLIDRVSENAPWDDGFDWCSELDGVREDIEDILELREL